MADLLRSICGSPLWDPEFKYATNPDFTQCFQNTVLLWYPCFILWLITPIWIYMLTKERQFKIKLSWLLICKTIVMSLLVILEIINIVFSVINQEKRYVHYITPAILIASFTIALLLTYYEHFRGLKTSVLLFSFWLILGLSALIILRSNILDYLLPHPKKSKREFIQFILFISMVVANWILSCFSEKNLIGPDVKSSKLYPENYVSLFSKLSFAWLDSLITTGRKRDLTKEDLWDIETSESSVYLTEKLQKAWYKEAKPYFEQMNKLSSEPLKKEFNVDDSGKDENVILDPHEELKSRQEKLKKPSLLLCLVSVFGGKFVAGASLKLIQDVLLFIGPSILGLLIDFVGDKRQSAWMGYFYTILLLIISIAQTVALQHYFHRMFIVSVRIRTAFMNMIYKKSLVLSTISRKESTTGQMVNLLAVDSQMFLNLTMYVNMVWSAPLQIIVSLILLWQQIGISTLVGFSTMVFFIPLNIWFSHITKKYRQKKMKLTDSRIKTTNEILNGIKIIKLYGWELSFQNIISEIRNTELGVLRKNAFFSTASSFLWMFAPIVVSMSSFAAYVLIDRDNILDPKKAFVCLALFNILRFPISMFPMVISGLIEASVSLARIRSFLLKLEQNENDVEHAKIDGVAVQFENVNVGWDMNKISLKNLTFRVREGDLVAVIGSVGSGKSSLLSSILGDMYKFNGRMNVNRSIAYVGQQAWIQNATLKANILFGSLENSQFYEKVVDACQLRPDFKILSAGDQTEIGEKGINLSGGQKARINLARAVYSDSGLYLLDDPLSAVDSHVSKAIFEEVIGPKGLLSKKTRVFVTNSLNYLPQVDKIILIANGEIVEMGTYDELKKLNGEFCEYTKSYMSKDKFVRSESEEPSVHEDGEEEEEDDGEEVANEELSSTQMTVQKRKSFKCSYKKLPEIKPKDGGEKIISVETAASGSVKLSTFIEYAKACKWYWSIIFLVSYLVSNILSFLSSIWLSDWTNKMQEENSDPSKRNMRLLIYVVLGISQTVFIFLADCIFNIMFIKASNALHTSMLSSILRSTMGFFEATPVGRIINRFSKDIEAVDGSIPEAYKSLIRCLFVVILSIVMVSISTPLFLISFVPIFILYIFIQRLKRLKRAFVAATRQLKRLEAVSRSPIFTHFSETLNGVSTIKAYSAQKRFAKTMENIIDENLCYYYPNSVLARWLAVRLELIGTLIGFFAALFAVIGRHSISAGLAGLSISYALNITQTLNWLVRQVSDLEASITSVERIKEYMETPHEAPWVIENKKVNESWPHNGDVKFVDYSVKYREDLDYVLKHICCNIEPKEKIGIVGRTGAGKSSMTLALFRLLESENGSIVIDDIDIKTIGLHELRQRITIIPQEAFLFSGTLKINIDPFKQFTDEQLWDVLEKAHLKTFVQGLDKQLLFECSEGGENLSVGQRQLVCLARALLRKTKILILDEATASVDHNTDDLIQQTIRKEFHDCTILTIAHRINTIMDSSRILVLDKGQIAEFDTPAALLANKNSQFYSIAKSASRTSN